MNQQEKTKTAKLLKVMIDEGKRANHNVQYSAVLSYYQSLGGEEEDIELEAGE